ncbi:hypothetical protein PMIN06_008059 [Paraphaeosphaeria minitans]|uniref:Uncharacterized protein n=1 Tax=Paraphaeosphaeria minitans TaxID=565426 RepID=A0A9P6GES5_9PLEO|nr:hypothetical protein PMIN01_08427 [Paraphaeosphaeria minitans]
MKLTALTAAFIIAFTSAQESGSAHPEFSDVPSFSGDHSFAARPTGVFPSDAPGFARPPGHHGHPHHRPSGASGFAHPSGAGRTDLPAFSGFSSATGPSEAAPTDAGFQRRQESSGLLPLPSGLPSGISSGAFPSTTLVLPALNLLLLLPSVALPPHPAGSRRSTAFKMSEC